MPSGVSQVLIQFYRRGSGASACTVTTVRCRDEPRGQAGQQRSGLRQQQSYAQSAPTGDVAAENR